MESKKQIPVCEHCGQKLPTKYKYFLDDLDVSALLKIYNAVIRAGVNKIKITSKTIPELSDGERHRITQLRFHGMLAKVKGENGHQLPGMWCLTSRAGAFLKGEQRVPAYVYTMNNKVIGHAIDDDIPEKDKWKARDDYKVLYAFRATYEIVNYQVKPL